MQVKEGNHKGSYINVEKAMSNEETRAIVLNNAKMELVIFRNKYKKFNEFAKVMEAIDVTLGKEVLDGNNK